MPLKGKGRVFEALDDVVEKKERELTKEIVSTFTQIIIGTPRDTGRAANNFFIRVDGSTGSTRKRGGDHPSDSLRQLERMPKSIFGKKVRLINNLPYIVPLEYEGHSRQAPNGWIRDLLGKFRKRVKKL